jgi:hypothetical protein
MTTKEKITLPNEEGEWEPMGYGFQGDPGEACTLTVTEWPGSQNVRMFRRVQEKQEVRIEPLDAVELKHFDRALLWMGNTETSKIDGSMCYIGIDHRGKQVTFDLEDVVRVWRKGSIVFPSTARA